ncbi:hypothetical protein B0J14DRAFT_214892 [Halenospora varia]|nr:hypothetical protein B0J14DRAFT_214892 [Halenospora varia]
MVYLIRWISRLVLLGLWQSKLTAAAGNYVCYRKIEGEVEQSSNVGPCGIVYANSGTLPCCNMGDYCLSNGLCKYPVTPPNPPNGYSGYYAASCTDKSYNDSLCNPNCADLRRAGVVYNEILNKWLCCGTENGSNMVNCSIPTTEDFTAPSPSALIATFSVLPNPSIVFSTSGPPSSLTSTSMPTHTSSLATASAGTSQGLSTGAKAGIGVGAALGGIALLALVGFICGRRRAADRTSPDVKEETAVKPITMPPELHYNPIPKEVPAETGLANVGPIKRHELPV